MLIFIAGVHGVGKGFLCETALTHFEVIHKSASALIKENSQVTFSKDKNTANIDKNQAILLNALSELRKNDVNLLLDGHFTLVNKEGVITDISKETFLGMNIDYIILISEPEEVVKGRILSRDGIDVNYDLKELIRRERQNAIKISKELSLPFHELKSPTPNEFINKLRELSVRVK